MLHLNNIETAFLEQLDIKKKEDLLFNKDGLLEYFGTCKLSSNKSNLLTDFEDGMADTRVYCRGNFVLNFATLEKETKSLRAIRVVNNGMLFQLKETFVKGKLTEIIISAGVYGDIEETIIKMVLKDRFQADVFLKAYIMRMTSKITHPCYIDCSEKNARLFDSGDASCTHRRVEPACEQLKTSNRDFIILLTEVLNRKSFADKKGTNFFLKIMPFFTLIYDTARDSFRKPKRPQTVIKNVMDSRNGVLSAYGKRENAIKSEAKQRVFSDDKISDIEKKALYAQYIKMLELLKQEGQIDIRTVFEVGESQDSIGQR